MLISPVVRARGTLPIETQNADAVLVKLTFLMVRQLLGVEFALRRNYICDTSLFASSISNAQLHVNPVSSVFGHEWPRPRAPTSPERKSESP